MLNSEDPVPPSSPVKINEGLRLPEIHELSPRGADSAELHGSADWQSPSSEWKSASLSDDEGDRTTRSDEGNSPMNGGVSRTPSGNGDLEVTITSHEYNKLFRSASIDQGVNWTAAVGDPDTRRSGMHKYTTFSVRITDASGRVTSSTRKRFTDFTVLRRELVKAYPGAFVPPLTCKSQIKVMMKAAPSAMSQHMKPVDNVTEIRRQALEEFLSRCCSRPFIMFSPIMAAFLATPESTYDALRRDFSNRAPEEVLDEYKISFAAKSIPSFDRRRAALDGPNEEAQRLSQEDSSDDGQRAAGSADVANGTMGVDSSVNVPEMLATSKTYLSDHCKVLNQLLTMLRTAASSFKSGNAALSSIHYKFSDCKTIDEQGSGHALAVAQGLEGCPERLDLSDAFFEVKNILSAPADALHFDLLSSVISREITDCGAMKASLDKVLELGKHRDKAIAKLRSAKKHGGAGGIGGYIRGTTKDQLKRAETNRVLYADFYWTAGYNAVMNEMPSFMEGRTRVYNEVAREFVSRSEATNKSLATMWVAKVKKTTTL
ncbi:hypothetical protein FOL47_010639 [Perkinsus chesapeaki]|uniref:PX domain-containing protein n=1 Tax=Perkinsus chesapeaki TaxID=330153 RepID=A0A7J6MP72_PERCH|nr:hypothetical protein FOL47_010639 [Perkinsus chesapeaki]